MPSWRDMSYSSPLRPLHRLARHITNGRDRPLLSLPSQPAHRHTPITSDRPLLKFRSRDSHQVSSTATRSVPASIRLVHSLGSSASSDFRRSHLTSRNTRPDFRRCYSSTNPKNVGWRDLNPFRTQETTQQRGTGYRDLPPLSSFIDDNHGPGRILKPTNEPRLRCTEFDEHGNVTLVNGEFKKSELIAKYGLLPRDLRKIDSSLLPHITVRPSAILVNLLHLRVLIKHDRVLVFDAYGSTDSYTQSVFMYDLEGKLRQVETKNNGSLPYEFRALEAVLISVTTGLESEFEGVREPVVRVLRELEEDIDRDKLRYLLVYSKKLGTFEQKARLVRDALDELLESDEDLEDMYLSEKAKGIERHDEDHTDIELLLESYHKVTDEIVQGAENLVSNIRNTEEIVKAILDANRNSLMLLELRFSVMTLGLGAGTFVAALYGMNLKNFIEESDFGFWGVSMSCAVLSAVTLMWGLKVLRRVQRVSMWGSGGSSGGNKLSAASMASSRQALKEQRKLLKAGEGKGGRSPGGGSSQGGKVGQNGWSWGLGAGSADAGLQSTPGAASELKRQVRMSPSAAGALRDAQVAARRSSRGRSGSGSESGQTSTGSSLSNTQSGMGAKPSGLD